MIADAEEQPSGGDVPITHRRVGLLVPPANPVAEPETTYLLNAFRTVHTARFPVMGGPLPTRLKAYNHMLPDIIGSFGGLSLDTVVVGCSGSRYLMRPEEDEASCQALSRRWGMPVATATFATRRILQRLRPRELVLVSPYQPWLTELARRFWRRAGWVVRVVPIQAAGRYAPYEVDPRDLVDQVEHARLAEDAVLLCTGTGMATLAALPPLAAGNDRVLLTSNICGAWWALHQTGDAASDDLPWALRRLASQGLTP
ncbi:maleate cis-trans isomerase family protein [Nonomuraea fuscirosea]|uniref:maleate cis-trans isomerase family protein n=1 Tax=Nonomuraea fuscirosea TaxID=1291556 RepID=UPI0011B235B2|nr:arylmalonate decarboxylase [Nonomuraea fuscirosea]